MAMAMAMAKRFVAASAVALLGCSPSLSLDGAWRSDRERTLAELETAGSFTDEQWAFLSSPGLFGHLIVVFEGNRAINVFEGECHPYSEFEVLEDSEDRKLIRYFDSGLESVIDQEILLEENHLYMPFGSYRFPVREAFTRISVEEAFRLHPCLSAIEEGT